MEELEKDVKYFTRLWQEELTRRQAAETALRNLVAAADKLIGEVETAGEHGYLGIQDDTYNKLADETTAAKEVLR